MSAEGTATQSYKPQLSTSINYGHILTTVTLAVSLIGGVFYGARWQATTDERVSRLIGSLPTLEEAITKLTAAQLVQSEQIKNLATLAAEARARSQTIEARLGTIQGDIDVIKSRTPVRR